MSPSSRTLVTGRVSKNVLGLFSSGVAETLEVKLRLLAVPACPQSDFFKNMDTYRELSRILPVDFDPSAWGSFLQENPNARDMAEQLRSSAPLPHDNPMTGASAGMEVISRLMSPATLDGPAQYFEATLQQGYGQPVAGMPSPMHMADQGASPLSTLDLQQDVMNDFARAEYSRPASRASTGGIEMASHDFQAGASHSLCEPAERASQDFRVDTPHSGCEATDRTLQALQAEGPTKKRVRTTKAGWKGKAIGGPSADSLRVTASTAASMRTIRPLAAKPGVEGTSLDEPVRPPTPRPNPTKMKPRRGRPRREASRRSELPLGPLLTSPMPSELSPRLPAGTLPNMSAPEDAHVASPVTTPMDVASSPPVSWHPSPAPSSPVLPVLPLQADSGFMSGPVEELPDDDNEMRAIDDEDRDVVARYSQRVNTAADNTLVFKQVTPGPPELLPTRILPRPRPSRKKSEASTAVLPDEGVASPQESQHDAGTTPSEVPECPSPQQATSPPNPADRTASPATVNQPWPAPRSVSRTPSIGGLILPSQPAGEPAAEPADTSIGAVAAETSQTDDGTTNQMRSGSGAKRRRAIQKRLQEAIKTGEMPPFCENCGAIETPTWRKAWRKKFEGSTLDVSQSTANGGVLAVQHVEKDESGQVVSFTILKRTLFVGDVGFKEIVLCNRELWLSGLLQVMLTGCTACGLWLQKFKCMRPEEKWNKDPKDTRDRKRRASKKRKQSDGGDNGAAASDAPDTTGSGGENRSSQESSKRHNGGPSGQPVNKASLGERQRAASLQPCSFDGVSEHDGVQGKTAASVTQRAVQSSPVRGLGTQDQPIELDDFGSTRRLLFPSPKRPQALKVLQDVTTNGNCRTDKRVDREPALKRHNTDASTGSNKENRTPAADDDVDDLDQLFGDDGSNQQQLPRTPSPRKSPLGASVGSSSRSTLRRRQRYQSSPWKFDLSPSSQRQGLPPQTPSTGNRSKTPRSPSSSSSSSSVKRRGQQQQLSPFTAQMYQVLSEGTFSPTGGGSGGGDDDTRGRALDGTNPFGDLLPECGLAATPGKAYPNLFINSDLLTTDIQMPSSPPNLFSLYEDPVEPLSGMWSDFDVVETK